MLKTEQNIDPLSSYREKIHDKYFSPKSRIETSPFSYYYHKNSLKKIPKTQFLPSQPKKSNFTLKLPGIAFKKIVISGSKLKVASKLPTETIRKFSATKKTIPLNLLNEKEETKRKASKAINEFYPKQENNRSRSPTLSRSYSLTKSSSFSKSPRARSPTRNDSSSKDLSSFIKNPKYFGNKNAQNKAKDFLDIYMNSFIESPNNKSFSSNKKVELKTTPINDTGFQITPIRVEIDPEICAVKTAELRKKKNNDYNFMKVLLHYWKFENKEEEPKNRPKKQPKVMIWNRKINFKSLRQNLKQLLNFLSCVKLNLNEINSNIFPEKPYEKEGSYCFLKAIKYGNYEAVKSMLEKNKLFSLDYDYMERTGLHIASSKGHLLICKLLLQKGAYVNHLDKLDRTALYYAIENGNYQIANMLLYYKIEPWSKPTYDLKTLTEDENMLALLKKARQIHMCLRFTPPKLRTLVWKNEKEKLKNVFPWS